VSGFAGNVPASPLDHVESLGETGPQLRAGCGQADTRMVALKQPDPKGILKHPDLPADRALGHV
jgi:hypothetical protein